MEQPRKTWSAGQKQQHRPRRWLPVMLVTVAVLAVLGLLVWYAMGRRALPQSSAATGGTASEAASQPAQQAQTAQGGTRWETMAAAPQTVNTFAPVTPASKLYALPENGRVDLSYFDDALFVGDSISTGWDVFRTAAGLLPGAQVVAEKGASPPVNGGLWARNQKASDLYDPLATIVAAAPKKIYIMLGTNMLVSQSETVEDKLVADYGTFIDDLKTALPGVQIYVQSVLLPTAEGTASKPGLAPDRINRVNDRLAALAFQKDCYYLDVEEYLCQRGVLNWDIDAGDGVHINTDGYRGWLEYLVTHTAYSPQNTYTEAPTHY